MENLGIDTKNTSVSDFVKKLEHFMGFGLKYVNLWEFIQIKFICGLQNIVKRLLSGGKRDYRHQKHMCE